MKKYLLLILAFYLSGALSAQTLYFPPLVGDTWETTSPVTLGWDVSEVDSLYQYLEQENSKAFLVLKEGRIVLEKYFGTFQQDSLWVWFSAGKSLMATLAGIAQEEGLLSVSNPTSDYLGTGWTSLPVSQEQNIKVLNQLSMSAGLDESISFDCTEPACLQYLTEPGTRWYYHNSPYSLMRNVIESASGSTLNSFTKTRIRDKIGMDGFWVPAGYNNFFFSTPRSMARFGLMVLADGQWDGTSILADTTYMNTMLNTSQPMNPSYGYLWWLNGKSSYIPPGTPDSFPGPIAPNAPNDMFAAAGANGQFICIVPSEDLIMVRVGNANQQNLVPLDFLNEIWGNLNRVMQPTTGISHDNAVLPEATILEQNYPNPFNPTTTIRFQIDKGQHVQLAVFDITGSRVETLVNNFLSPGAYSIDWDAGSYTSGVYFYQLQTDELLETRRMILTR